MRALIKGSIDYTICPKTKQTIVAEESSTGTFNKPKGNTYVKDIGILVAIMKMFQVSESVVCSIVELLKEDYRNRKGYSNKI